MKKKILRSILLLFSVMCLILVYDLFHPSEMKKYTEFEISQIYLKMYHTFMPEEKFENFVNDLVIETNDIKILNSIMFFLNENNECFNFRNLESKCDRLEKIPQDSIWVEEISSSYSRSSSREMLNAENSFCNVMKNLKRRGACQHTVH